ncbi:MAG: electron transfer flavoprotein subunit beta/FixA family protein [Lentisphaerae bacterium]|nr:electron transfer flavoprotein subunit beta/FixA family protein [Lentisphaerota bacterium]MBT7061150.1 electron transfer flavoprotein subunit beta/FixA family protein [Lentisphaerota bacterium]MBT7844248.1 electron transfer flavoprotein subunit beta/FixA family protein [Lentisphaerota bacterium]
MHIIVCIKQVPYTTEVRINPETNTLIREGVESIVNPYDMYAVEEALRIRDRLGCGRITVLSMGPPQVETALRECLALGVDAAVLLCDRAFAGADTWSTSLTLSAALRRLDPGLILAGKQAIDGDTAQVGPGIACHLDLPQVCYVSRICEITARNATVERLLDHGHERVHVELPAVLTVVKEINEPRMPSLKGKVRARGANLTVWGRADLDVDADVVGLAGSPTAVNRIFCPPQRSGGGLVPGGSAAEVAGNLVKRLRADGVLSDGRESHG